MIVRSINKNYKSINKSEEYLVIEVNVNLLLSEIDYRIIDDNGCPALYNAKYFDIITNNLENMVLTYDLNGIAICHKIIYEYNMKYKNINGYWGYLFETASKASKEGILLLRDVINDLLQFNNAIIPDIKIW